MNPLGQQCVKSLHHFPIKNVDDGSYIKIFSKNFKTSRYAIVIKRIDNHYFSNHDDCYTTWRRVGK